VFEDAPSSTIGRPALLDGAVTLVDALVSSGLCGSRGEARRTVDQGGAYVNNGRQSDPDLVLRAEMLMHDRYFVLRRGKRNYHLLRVEP
jgi:tyrosyl-tRNA synthetase